MRKLHITLAIIALVFMTVFSGCFANSTAEQPVQQNQEDNRPAQKNNDAPQPTEKRDDTNIRRGSDQAYEDYDLFGAAISKLVKENHVTNWSAAAVAEDRFYFGRLIVQASGPIDFEEFSPVDHISGPDYLYIVQFSTSDEAEAAYKTLLTMPEVIYVEADGYLGSGTEQITASTSNSWGVSAIGADKLAAYVAAGTTDSITVAVVDSGVSDHPFLRGRIRSAGYDFVDNDATPEDLYSHGTHVAGTIVDCTPGLNVFILPVRVLNEKGYGFDSTVGAGVRYAADHGAKVINLSLGGGHSAYLDEAIRYAVDKGVCVVVAAGNEFGDTADFCPAHIRSAITVGAVDSNLQRADFSNTGASLDIACPGVDVVSCVPGGGYQSYSGTSMATPHAAASVAMLWLLYPAKTPSEIERLLCSHTIDLGASGWDESYGAGLPDLKQFVSKPDILPTGISLNRASMLMTVGSSEMLKATVSPSDAANQSVVWSSGNPAVAAVSSDGTVTAQAEGKTTVMAETVNGLAAVCEVTVEGAYSVGISVASEPYDTFYYVGEELDPAGLELAVTYADGTTEIVTDGYTYWPSALDAPGEQLITISYSTFQASFAVWVEEPTIALSTYYESVTKNCWDSYWNNSRKVPLWMLSYPTVSTNPGYGSVTWEIVSGEAYLDDDYIAAQQPGTVVVRAIYALNGHTYTADYTVTLNIYKTTTDINYFQSAPTRQSDVLATVPNGATVDITEVAWDASVQASNGRFYLWGKTVYNGISGWIVIS